MMEEMECICETGMGVPTARNDEEKSREIYHINFKTLTQNNAKN